MYCRYCGKEINDDAVFCQYCGKRLVGNDEEIKEEKKKEKVDEKFVKFKKDYSRGSLSGLIWYGAMSVIASVFLAIGYVIVGLIYISQGNDIFINGDLNFGVLFKQIVEMDYFIIVPICYLIGYAASAILAILISKKLVYKNEDNPEVFKKNIRKLTAKELLLVIACAFGIWGVGVVIGNLPEFLGLGSNDSTLDFIFGNYTILYVLMAMFGAPIIEELIFRKILIDKIGSHGEGLAVLVSGLLFGLMHGNLGQFFLAFNLGLLFAIVYIKTRNILYTMGLHFMINTYASLPEIVAMFDVDISEIWLYVTIGLCFVGLIIAIIFRKNELFKLDCSSDYDGNKIYRAVGYLIFFIILVVTLGTTTITLYGEGLIFDALARKVSLAYLAIIVPVGCFVVLMILLNKQLRTKFKARPQEVVEENLEQIEEVNEVEEEK